MLTFIRFENLSTFINLVLKRSGKVYYNTFYSNCFYPSSVTFRYFLLRECFQSKQNQFIKPLVVKFSSSAHLRKFILRKNSAIS